MISNSPNATPLGATPLLGAERFALWSERVGARFIIDIAMPSLPSPEGRKPGVLIVTDGNLCFPTAASLSSGLSVQPGGPPPLCVVGVGYEVSGGGEKMEHHKIRNRDLSPCPDPRFEAMMRRAPAPLTWDDDIKPGGATLFRAFLLEELLPWLSDHYDIDAKDRALAGISLGGLFALDTLFAQADAFQRYIAISPSIWWADRRVLAQAQAAPKLRDPVDLYLAVGAGEEAQDEHAKMVSNLRELASLLEQKADPNLRLSSDVIDGESHMTVFSPALGRALQRIYAGEDRRADWAQLDA